MRFHRLVPRPPWIARRPYPFIWDRMRRAEPRQHLMIGHQVGPRRQLIPADPSVLVTPVTHPVRGMLEVSHLERGAIRPKPGRGTCLPLHPREPLGVNLLRSGDQLLQLAIGAAE